MKPSILIVDDERSFRMLAEEALASEGFDVRTAGTLARAEAEVDASAPDVVLLDRKLPDGDGLDLVRRLRARGGGVLVVMVTAYGDVQHAVDALQVGAADYLTKPVSPTDLVVKLRKVLEARGLTDRLALARSSARQPAPVSAQSASARALEERLRLLAQSAETSVLILGPSGVGKQYAAERLHALTHGDDAPFVEVNCAALPPHLVESELFGHEKGAFTDAGASRRGLFELADGGTLFLDEVSELPPVLQAKLLKLLDTMRFRRLGGQREIEVRLRVVAASNQDVGELLRTARLREDLYHRLAVFVVEIPSLARRPEDIPALARAFVAHFAARVKKRVRGLSPGALAALAAYSYPGNVRELRNIMERAVILASGAEVVEGDLVLRTMPGGVAAPDAAFFSVAPSPDGTPPPLEAIERAYVARVLEHLGGRRTAAADALGISYPTLLKRLRELGLDQG